MTDVAVRAASEGDLGDVYDLFYRAQVIGTTDPPPPGDAPAFLKHLLGTGEMRVAERDGRIVGFAALVARDGVSYLAELFVRPEVQSVGVGNRLLGAVLRPHRRTACTVSSSDPRALALCVRAGMAPKWPMIWLRAQTAQMGRLPTGDAAVVAAEGDDLELVRCDAEIGGRWRPGDHRHWIAEGALPVWLARADTRIGYGCLQTRRESAPWSRDAITVGPLGTRTAADAVDAVCGAVEHARTLRPVVRFAIPGSHPALPALLAAGFRITDLGTFVAAPTVEVPDPARYLPSDDLL